ncbi:putative lactoylglutathione lyase [Rosa chinensis]|uniref:Putative lactoylglutathione lyase n=1 Tax=Rosa chinensis TaxID=74649 RepID=A0A2P6RFN8_ROSCH|nr:putative lactoylglutathione lyase [Rosa chinensis]
MGRGVLVLAAAGLVKGSNCTGFPPMRPVLLAGGAQWVEPDTMGTCIADGNIITGVTYEGNAEFIRLFVKALGGHIISSERRILFFCGRKAGDVCATTVHDFEGDQTYSEKPGHNFILTANFETINATRYDALVVPGGRAPEYLALNEKVIALVKHFMGARKPVASICQGQQILAATGVLQGWKCTAHPTVRVNVVLSEVKWVEPDPIDSSITDGNLVTGAVWLGHPDFISQLMALLAVRVSF